ncbi:pyridoxal phosphate-dependent aminotransferase [Kushneria aurantia]|uniref:Aminotransferase class I/II-fold pyridoxal phosphate-dependent enzyme n=1 Tax=Kushneria aurantia TaxID=504092 RepID=A0ABV6G096_9GAMM|nr:histidinol-phosphate transaminase [Kushneria aurantia]
MKETPADSGRVASRRKFLGMSGAALASVGLGGLALPGTPTRASEAVPSAPAGMATPSATHPIGINYNENALGMSPRAQLAAIDSISGANRYPFSRLAPFRQQLADHHGVAPASLLLTPGSSAGIRASIAAHARGSNTQLVIPELTYGDGEHHASNYGMSIARAPSSREDWSFEMADMRALVDNHDGASVVYLVNPNNPTATITPADEIEAWIESRPDDTIFVVDEAYGEFVNDPAFRSVDGLIARGVDNVILLKTFSKIHAMAGLRVGYLVAAPPLVEHVAGFIESDWMTLSWPGVEAASHSMRDDAFLARSKQSNDESRAILTRALEELGMDYLPSEANFVFHRTPVPLAQYQQLMKEHFVMVGRPFPPAQEWCRTSLGTPEQMRYVAQVMRNLRSQQRL